MERSYYWEHPDEPRVQNQAEAWFEPGGLKASGVQTGPGYAARWMLEALDNWNTQAIHVHVLGDGPAGEPGWSRMLELERSADGVWTCGTSAELVGPDMQPGIVLGEDLSAALDCDLGMCPLTNTMPIRRLGLLERDVPEAALVMAWIEMPSYSSVDARTVRYKSGTRGVGVELEVDEDGVVVRYPDMAVRK